MIKLKVTFYGILYGKQISEWHVTDENADGVSDTIKYLTKTGLKNLISIEMEKV